MQYRIENPGELAYYVYAVARPGAGRVPAPLPAEGIAPQTPVRAIAHRDLLAVVSPVPMSEFGPAALEARLEDANWAQARVLAHQEVLADLRDGYTLIPFKFCTLYTSEERVLEMLVRHYDALVRRLQRLEGATEWGVKLFVHEKLLTEWVVTSAEALQPLREAMTQAPQGAGYFLRKKLAQAAQDAVRETVGACAQESHQRLSECAREAVSNPVQPQQVHGRPAGMVLNGAYLVDDEAGETFRAALAALEDRYGSRGFQYELTGPWPPYNFATLDVKEIAGERSPVE